MNRLENKKLFPKQHNIVLPSGCITVKITSQGVLLKYYFISICLLYERKFKAMCLYWLPQRHHFLWQVYIDYHYPAFLHFLDQPLKFPALKALFSTRMGLPPPASSPRELGPPGSFQNSVSIDKQSSSSPTVQVS